MQFDLPLQSARLIQRYKRFLTDIELPDGQQLTIHCPNTGSMRGCLDDVKQVWYWDSGNPKRKYPHTLELIETNSGDYIGVNTGRANSLVKEAISNHRFNFLAHDSFRSEVKYGTENSRIDFLLDHAEQKTWIEVKSVTLLEQDLGDGKGFFPDAVSTRGTKHLRELMAQVQAGDRAILLYCVQHTGIKTVSVAEHIDKVYAATLEEARAAGVEIRVLAADITTDTITLSREIPFE